MRNRIEGVVLGERGRPIPGAKVAYKVDGRDRTARSDERGRFDIQVTGTKISLRAERKDGLLTVTSPAVEIDGTEGGEWEVDLVLEEGPQGGLGVSVIKNREGLRIRGVLDDGPGAELGLEIGDIILEVDGTPIGGFSTKKATGMLIGPAGSSVRVLVRHADGEEVEYSFRRQQILEK